MIIKRINTVLLTTLVWMSCADGAATSNPKSYLQVKKEQLISAWHIVKTHAQKKHAQARQKIQQTYKRVTTKLKDNPESALIGAAALLLGTYATTLAAYFLKKVAVGLHGNNRGIPVPPSASPVVHRDQIQEDNSLQTALNNRKQLKHVETEEQTFDQRRDSIRQEIEEERAEEKQALLNEFICQYDGLFDEGETVKQETPESTKKQVIYYNVLHPQNNHDHNQADIDYDGLDHLFDEAQAAVPVPPLAPPVVHHDQAQGDNSLQTALNNRKQLKHVLTEEERAAQEHAKREEILQQKRTQLKPTVTTEQTFDQRRDSIREEITAERAGGQPQHHAPGTNGDNSDDQNTDNVQVTVGQSTVEVSPQTQPADGRGGQQENLLQSEIQQAQNNGGNQDSDSNNDDQISGQATVEVSQQTDRTGDQPPYPAPGTDADNAHLNNDEKIDTGPAAVQASLNVPPVAPPQPPARRRSQEQVAAKPKSVPNQGRVTNVQTNKQNQRLLELTEKDKIRLEFLAALDTRRRSLEDTLPFDTSSVAEDQQKSSQDTALQQGTNVDNRDTQNAYKAQVAARPAAVEASLNVPPVAPPPPPARGRSQEQVAPKPISGKQLVATRNGLKKVITNSPSPTNNNLANHEMIARAQATQQDNQSKSSLTESFNPAWGSYCGRQTSDSGQEPGKPDTQPEEPSTGEAEQPNVTSSSETIHNVGQNPENQQAFQDFRNKVGNNATQPINKSTAICDQRVY